MYILTNIPPFSSLRNKANARSIKCSLIVKKHSNPLHFHKSDKKHAESNRFAIGCTAKDRPTNQILQFERKTP